MATAAAASTFLTLWKFPRSALATYW